MTKLKYFGINLRSNWNFGLDYLYIMSHVKLWLNSMIILIPNFGTDSTPSYYIPLIRIEATR
jgi:hypothetical protein